jgi:chromosome segregation and condensation protein ScpB
MQIQQLGNTQNLAPRNGINDFVARMNTIELLALVNQARSEFGESEVRRNVFVARCKDELEGEHYKTFVVQNLNNTESTELELTKDQCMYVLMRESKSVRRKVVSKLNEVDARQAIALPSYAETLRLYADQIEQTAVLQIANDQQAKKIESLEHLFMAGETPSQFVKRLNGVNAQKINATLLELGWIYNAESEPDRSPKYRTTSKARSQLLLTERPRKIDGEGFDKPLIRYDLQMLETGARRLHDLYLDLRLTMKKTWDQQFFYAKFSEEASQ